MSAPNTDFSKLRAALDPQAAGSAIHALIRDLYPICRSITGDGTRQTLARLKNEIPIEASEVPSGTQVFDWTVPREWNIRDAYVKNSNGERVIDFPPPQPARGELQRALCGGRCRWPELRPHLHTLPDQPDLIPIAPPTTRRPGASACPHRNWSRCLRANTRFA
jgi:aminopeptidase-like protein